MSFAKNWSRSRYSDVHQMRLSPRIGIGKEALLRSTAMAIEVSPDSDLGKIP
jgi:hypothetical protein